MTLEVDESQDIAELVEAILEPVHGDKGLRLEGGGAFNGSAALGYKHRQQ